MSTKERTNKKANASTAAAVFQDGAFQGPQARVEPVQPQSSTEERFTDEERQRFNHLVGRVYNNSLDTGLAIMALRDEKLWKKVEDHDGNLMNYKTFDEFCAEWFGHDKTWVAKVVGQVKLNQELGRLGIDVQIGLKASSGILNDHRLIDCTETGTVEDGLVAVMKEAKADGDFSGKSLKSIIERLYAFHQAKAGNMAYAYKPLAADYAAYKADCLELEAAKLPRDGAIFGGTHKFNKTALSSANLLVDCEKNEAVPQWNKLLSVCTGADLIQAIARLQLIHDKILAKEKAQAAKDKANADAIEARQKAKELGISSGKPTPKPAAPTTASPVDGADKQEPSTLKLAEGPDGYGEDKPEATDSPAANEEDNAVVHDEPENSWQPPKEDEAKLTALEKLQKIKDMLQSITASDQATCDPEAMVKVCDDCKVELDSITKEAKKLLDKKTP